MFFLLVPRFEGSIVEGFARAVVSLFAPPLLATKTPALNSCISNTCNLIENNRLYPLHSQHLQKTGGRGHKPVPRSDHTRKPIPFTQLQFARPQLLSFDKSPRTEGYTHPHWSNQSPVPFDPHSSPLQPTEHRSWITSVLCVSSAHSASPRYLFLFLRSPLACPPKPQRRRKAFLPNPLPPQPPLLPLPHTNSRETRILPTAIHSTHEVTFQ